MNKDQAYIDDMQKCVQKILDYISGKSFEEFAADSLLQDGVIRRLELLGEMVKRVSENLKTQNPNISWSKMVGMRNFMIHEYDAVDVKILWETATKDIEDLSGLLKKIKPLE